MSIKKCVEYESSSGVRYPNLDYMQKRLQNRRTAIAEKIVDTAEALLRGGYRLQAITNVRDALEDYTTELSVIKTDLDQIKEAQSDKDFKWE